MVSNKSACDVAIIGGGPVGSTAATLLRKYAPELHVLVVEKEIFPRDHIGESLLPPICTILNEMGAWDAIEAAGFPVKIGASYTWGRDQDRWDFDFYPVEKWRDEPRPGRYEGQRRFTAFQVDRSRYDQILLDHAQAKGAEVRQGTRVDEVLVNGDRIEGLKLDTGEVVTAQYYIDGSGTAALFRRALGIGIDPKLELRNIAVWDYWTNAEWAVEIGVGATRIQVRSLPYGWIWFIPIGATRTSIGVVCPAEYYKQSGLTAEELYARSLQLQPEIQKLVRSATAEGKITTCRDWSHLADRIAGENWFVCGEAAGFADPILSAGMTLAHQSAREAAYTIIEDRRGEHDPAWLRQRYDEKNRTAIRQHIRFAQYWYAANSCFTDLKDHCASIAREAGLNLAPQEAWDWLSRGGFTSESETVACAGSLDPASTKKLIEMFDRGKRKTGWLMDGHNVFELNLRGAGMERVGYLEQGRIQSLPCYVRDGQRLPVAGFYARMIDVLQQTSDFTTMVELIGKTLWRIQGSDPKNRDFLVSQHLQVLEAMIQEGWVERKVNEERPNLHMKGEVSQIRSSRAGNEAMRRAGRGALLRSRIDDPGGGNSEG